MKIDENIGNRFRQIYRKSYDGRVSKKGYQVKAFVYYNSFNIWGWLDTMPKEIMDSVEIFQGDIRDPNGVGEARKLNIKRVLITSTSEVYGTAQYVPIDEKHSFQGQLPYLATKIGADRLAER